MKGRSRWFEFRLDSGGMLGFMLHRLTGIGLVVYLYLHLALLNQLRQGPAAWDAFVQSMRSPWVLLADLVLLFGILMHGLNGLRLTLLGFGKFLRWQQELFWSSLILAVVLTAWGMLAMH